MFTMYGDYSHMMWLLHNIKTMQIYKFTHNPVFLLFVHNLTECQGGLLLTGMINIHIFITAWTLDFNHFRVDAKLTTCIIIS